MYNYPETAGLFFVVGRGGGVSSYIGMKIQYDPCVTDLLVSFWKFFTSSYRW